MSNVRTLEDIAALFDTDAARARAALSPLETLSVSETERIRIAYACSILCAGQIEKLESQVRAALEDYRDVLFAAFYQPGAALTPYWKLIDALLDDALLPEASYPEVAYLTLDAKPAYRIDVLIHHLQARDVRLDNVRRHELLRLASNLATPLTESQVQFLSIK